MTSSIETAERLEREAQQDEVLKAGAVKFVYNVFFLGPEGFGEHLQVETRDKDALVAGRSAVVVWLQRIQAKPQPRDRPYSGAKKPWGGSPSQPADPMTAAAQQVMQASVVRDCPAGHGSMKLIRNLRGSPGRDGTPWPDFYACQACREKQNA